MIAIVAIAAGIFLAGALFGALVVSERGLWRRARASYMRPSSMLDLSAAAARGQLVDWEDPRA